MKLDADPALETSGEAADPSRRRPGHGWRPRRCAVRTDRPRRACRLLHVALRHVPDQPQPRTDPHRLVRVGHRRSRDDVRHHLRGAGSLDWSQRRAGGRGHHDGDDGVDEQRAVRCCRRPAHRTPHRTRQRDDHHRVQGALVRHDARGVVRVGWHRPRRDGWVERLGGASVVRQPGQHALAGHPHDRVGRRPRVRRGLPRPPSHGAGPASVRRRQQRPGRPTGRLARRRRRA